MQGRYRIISQLGRGGMGAVYVAEDKKRFDASVALKEILIDLADIDSKQHELLKRAFEREAKILAEVQHEVFPHVIEYFSESDRQFLVMELIQGADLAQLLVERKKPFPIEEILHWSDQLLDALDYLHSYNPPIFHRDLKPQNLKLTSRGKIKLLDFGIAKNEEANLTATISNQTFIAATLNYSPFEQILRVIDSTLREVITQRYEEKVKRILERPADAQSDLYALGATLYHLSTAFIPTDALKRTLDVWSDKPDPLRRPHELNPNIPEEVSLVFLKAMEIERENRFASATEMRQALNKAGAKIKRRDQEAAKKREEAQRAIWLAEQAQLEKERMEKEHQLAEQERLPIKQLMQAKTERFIKESEVKAQTENDFITETQPASTQSSLTLPSDVQPSAVEDFFTKASLIEISNTAPSESASKSELTGTAYFNEPLTYNKEIISEPLPIIQKKSGSKSDAKLFWILPIAAVCIFAVGGIGGIFWWIGLDSTNSVTPAVNPEISTPTVTPTVEPTVEPTIEPSASPIPSPTTNPTTESDGETEPTPLPKKTPIQKPSPVKTPPIQKTPIPKPPSRPSADCIYNGRCN